MRKLSLLTVLCMMGMLVYIPAAFGQSRGPSGADGSYNCPDFDTQEEAQAFFDQDPSDPDGLDADDDGQACEDSLPSGGAPTETTPETTTSDGLMDAGGDLPATKTQYEDPATPTPQASAAVLPDTGGASLMVLGSGVLLVVGGLILRRR